MPVIEAALERDVRVALPVVIAKGKPLEFRIWRPGDRVTAGVFGIPFPADGPTVVPDLMLIPLVGFDRAGYRLGYGGGYYDRTLAAAVPRPATIGVGFELSRLESIGPEPHDVAMDWIVTEAGIFGAGPGDRPPA